MNIQTLLKKEGYDTTGISGDVWLDIEDDFNRENELTIEEYNKIHSYEIAFEISQKYHIPKIKK
jgi:hypothetical protein